MKVLIYTAQHKGAVDQYNIHQMMVQRPGHEYKMVAVRNDQQEPTAWKRFKRIVVQLRDGRDQWATDAAEFDKAIRAITPTLPSKHVDGTLVERVNDPESQQIISSFAPDVIVQAGAGILTAEVFELSALATINVHHGLAPEIRGMRSTFWCLYYGLSDLIGVTCHRIDATLDTGEVLAQYRYPYTKGDDLHSIQMAITKKGAELLITSLDLLKGGSIASPQRYEVDSYYFSRVGRDQYTALKKNGFLPVGDPSELKIKRKVKVIAGKVV